MYAITCTRPSIAFVVGKPSRYTSNPSNRILNYLKHTMDYGIYYTRYPSILEGFWDVVMKKFNILASARI